MSKKNPPRRNHLISLADEEAVKQVLVNSVLGLWDVVNNLTRLKPSRRDRFRVTIFGSARVKPGTFGYEETKRAAVRSNNSNAGAIFVILEPFDERTRHGPSADKIAMNLRMKLSTIQEAIFDYSTAACTRAGKVGGFTMGVQDLSGAGFSALQSATEELVAAANQQPGCP
jgi:hypothetical protein